MKKNKIKTKSLVFNSDKCLLERVESILTEGVKLPGDVLLDETCQ